MLRSEASPFLLVSTDGEARAGTSFFVFCNMQASLVLLCSKPQTSETKWIQMSTCVQIRITKNNIHKHELDSTKYFRFKRRTEWANTSTSRHLFHHGIDSNPKMSQVTERVDPAGINGLTQEHAFCPTAGLAPGRLYYVA
jgi:hypothetical protein